MTIYENPEQQEPHVVLTSPPQALGQSRSGRRGLPGCKQSTVAMVSLWGGRGRPEKKSKSQHRAARMFQSGFQPPRAELTNATLIKRVRTQPFRCEWGDCLWGGRSGRQTKSQRQCSWGSKGPASPQTTETPSSRKAGKRGLNSPKLSEGRR